jgi:hypothetical protein
VVGLDGSLPREVRPEFFSAFLYGGWGGVAWHPDGQRVSAWGEHSTSGPHFWTMPLVGGRAVKSEITPEVEQQLKEAAQGLGNFVW